MLQFVTVVPDLHDSSYISDNDFSGVFSVASNALYRLDRERGRPYTHLLPFLGKLLIALGVFPRVDSCPGCNRSLTGMKQLALDASQGGFLCEYCLLNNESLLDTSSCAGELYLILKEIAWKKYQEMALGGNRVLFDSLLNYFCHQFEISHHRFKALPTALQTFPPSS